MNLINKYKKKIKGVISCYDRIVIQGTLPYFCYAEGMTSFLYANKIRIFDYPLFAKKLRDELRDNAERIAKENNLKIEFIRKNNFRKEKQIKNILKQRGAHPGIVHIFSAMEACSSYKPWHDKETHKTFLKPTSGKCLHYYFYFIDKDLGLCYIRIPTWCPFRLQFYYNGHNHLASELTRKKIKYILLENSFVAIDNFNKAQKIVTKFDISKIHKILDTSAKIYCPVIKHFQLCYHWSIMQAEYATDIVFKCQKELKIIYDYITRTAIHTVKPKNIATFLGRKLHGNFQDEMGNNFNTRIEGTRIKHSMGPVSLKMYDKFSLVLRIETTVNNVSFFKHYRLVEHKNGTRSKKIAQMKKGIYSLPPLRELLMAVNRRYLEFISAIDDQSAGIKKLNKISKSIVYNNRSYKGFNFFSEKDQTIFEKIISGDFLITGFQNKTLRESIPEKNTGQISRLIKRLRVHGLIKKVRNSYKYYPTKYGLEIIIKGLKLKELYFIPALSINR
jgi:hypothetical protein